ncbi:MULTISPECIES: phosphopantetheine-binding protein [unclassified Amycolatopsis]|uniref:acyl carrier protein n=1 Tax=unclassified Amycolatopsis TaxID=2618356 RepID=UPI001FF4F974|nr:phosphopantetheine-binding protein [Amycolatopsis sp. FBCC-B4732]UOX92984.1 acyl carrier protein [Amycolatopsis sp. FBCC-B4732]
MKTDATAAEQAVLDRLRACLGEVLPVEPLAADYDLIASGVLDSSRFLAVFVELEDHFGIRITGDDISQDNFRTLERIARFVRAKGGDA